MMRELFRGGADHHDSQLLEPRPGRRIGERPDLAAYLAGRNWPERLGPRPERAATMFKCALAKRAPR